MFKQFLSLFILGLSKITWNGFRPHFACREAIQQLFRRKIRGQGARLWRVGGADCTPRMMDKPLDKGV